MQHKHAFLRRQFVVFAVSFLLGGKVDAKAWVKVWNKLGPRQNVWIGCESVDRYVSVVDLVPDATYYFGFHNNLAGTTITIWQCTFDEDGTSCRQSFAVWDHTSHSKVPLDCHQCLRVLHEDGFSVWDKSGQECKFFVRWLDGVKQNTIREAAFKDRLKILLLPNTQNSQKIIQEKIMHPAVFVSDAQTRKADDQDLASLRATAIGESKLYVHAGSHNYKSREDYKGHAYTDKS